MLPFVLLRLLVFGLFVMLRDGRGFYEGLPLAFWLSLLIQHPARYNFFVAALICTSIRHSR